MQRIEWRTVPGEAGFAYAVQGGQRVAHIVRSNGSWSAFVTHPTLSTAGNRRSEKEAKAYVRDFLKKRSENA